MEIPGTEDLKPYITAKDKGKSGCSAQLVWRSFRQHWRRLCRYLFTEGDTYMKYKIEEKHRTGDADHSAVCAEGLLRTIPESLPGRNSGSPD